MSQLQRQSSAGADRAAPAAADDATPGRGRDFWARSSTERVAAEQPAARFRAMSDERSAIGADLRRRSRPEAPSGGGRALPDGVQSKMERSFGADLSSVRVHEGAHVGAMGTRAYAQGPELHFASGAFQPDSAEGQSLIGHELSHVVQGAQGRVAATGRANGQPVGGDASLEREADVMGASAARGEPTSAAPARVAASAAPRVAMRKESDARKYVESHSLAVTVDLENVTAYVKNKENPKQHRLGLLEAWNQELVEHRIERPLDLSSGVEILPQEPIKPRKGSDDKKRRDSTGSDSSEGSVVFNEDAEPQHIQISIEPDRAFQSDCALLQAFGQKFRLAANHIARTPSALEVVQNAEAAGVKFGGIALDWSYTVGKKVFIKQGGDMEAMSDFLFELHNAMHSKELAKAIDAKSGKEYARAKVTVEVDNMLTMGKLWVDMKKGQRHMDQYDEHFFQEEYDEHLHGKSRDEIVNDVLKYKNGSDPSKTNEEIYSEQYEGTCCKCSCIIL